LARPFDEGTLELPTPFGGSGFVAATALVNGAKAAPYASDPPFPGRCDRRRPAAPPRRGAHGNIPL
jgi:hypothetical protein